MIRPIALARRAAMAAAIVGVTAQAAPAQARLVQVVEGARAAWLAHDVEHLVERSDTVRLRIPGVAVTAAVRPRQAARLLSGYLAHTVETAFVLKEIRNVGADHAYAEMIRRYVVQGTSDERLETVFFGFRVIDGEWRLREVRVTP
ncbi:MAG TPA: hypothetical protein VGA37_02985 [Gemmatimonadales bacterium]